jgi:hypothetical protein
MFPKTSHIVRTAIASIVLLLGVSTACDDGTPFRGTEPGWDSLGLTSMTDASTGVLLLDRPYLYVCGGRSGLYRGVVNRSAPHWKYLGFADSTVVADAQAEARANGAIDGTLVGAGVLDIAVTDGGRLLVATDYRLVSESQEVTWLPQVYRSDDRGDSWQTSDDGLIYPGVFREAITCLEASRCGDGFVFAGSGAWLFRSLDNGASWDPIASVTLVADVQVHPQDCSVWVGGGSLRESGMLVKSVDGGLSWEGVHPILDEYGKYPYGVEVSRIALDPNDPDRVYVLIPWGGINRTEDGGSIWTTPFFYSNKRTGAMALDGGNTQHLFIGFGAVVHESADGGVTYEDRDVPDGSEILDMAYDTYDADLYVATKSGVYRYRTR